MRVSPPPCRRVRVTCVVCHGGGWFLLGRGGSGGATRPSDCGRVTGRRTAGACGFDPSELVNPSGHDMRVGGGQSAVASAGVGVESATAKREAAAKVRPGDRRSVGRGRRRGKRRGGGTADDERHPDAERGAADGAHSHKIPTAVAGTEKGRNGSAHQDNYVHSVANKLNMLNRWKSLRFL